VDEELAHGLGEAVWDAIRRFGSVGPGRRRTVPYKRCGSVTGGVRIAAAVLGRMSSSGRCDLLRAGEILARRDTPVVVVASSRIQGRSSQLRGKDWSLGRRPYRHGLWSKLQLALQLSALPDPDDPDDPDNPDKPHLGPPARQP